MRIIDISPAITPSIAVWPGDVPYARDVSVSFEQGGNLDLSAIHTTLHVGAHADAPSHYHAEGVDIASRSLAYYLGPAQVIAVDVARGQRIEPADLPCEVRAPRVLFRTGTFPDPNAWNTDFAAFSPALIDWLAERGVILVGIDTPSVDLFDDSELVCHNAIYAHDMANLEGLCLAHVDPGLYELIALPLKLVDADASPVRAVLLAR